MLEHRIVLRPDTTTASIFELGNIWLSWNLPQKWERFFFYCPHIIFFPFWRIHFNTNTPEWPLMNSVETRQSLLFASALKSHYCDFYIIAWYCKYFIDELWFITTDQFVVPYIISWNIKIQNVTVNYYIQLHKPNIDFSFCVGQCWLLFNI